MRILSSYIGFSRGDIPLADGDEFRRNVNGVIELVTAPKGRSKAKIRNSIDDRSMVYPLSMP